MRLISRAVVILKDCSTHSNSKIGWTYVDGPSPNPRLSRVDFDYIRIWALLLVVGLVHAIGIGPRLAHEENAYDSG